MKETTRLDKDGVPQKRFAEFDCPECNANNPVDFYMGDEVYCSYCGIEFVVAAGDGGKFKLREV